MPSHAQIITPGSFEVSQHWYEKALNAQIHPLVAFFMYMSPERIINRYCHMNPRVNKDKLAELLEYKPKYFFHAGADLFHVTNAKGDRKMVVIETNSSPSGQKSMPLLEENQEQGGYYTYISQTFYPQVKKARKVDGGLAVIYDKNPMEASGYAATMADFFDENVYYAPYYLHDMDPPVRFNNQVLEIRTADGVWNPVRAAFRYVTQKPWKRIPLHTKTIILNPTITCLAGGRNKMMADKAYEFFNAEIAPYGLQIRTPETLRDVHKEEIPFWVKRWGGHAVIKIPYSNAGQGVFTIVNERELSEFMEKDYEYNLFIVQSLIGNYNWSSHGQMGRLYHVGTMPNKKNLSYVADIRMMIHSTSAGLRPMAIYARRARKPLVDNLQDTGSSWDVLGTNLSVKNPDGTFVSESTRLMLMDRRDFNRLGVGLDDLIEGYIQTVLSLIAIDQMARNLVNSKGRFRMKLFRSLNDDSGLIDEIVLE